MIVYEVGTKAAGLEYKEVERIARGLSRYAKQARDLGLTVFGGSGSGSLRFDDGGDGQIICAELHDGWFDGGDGACDRDKDGILRGEYA